mgnify:CR=1 FL=1
MTQQEIIEQIQQVHPEIGETQLRLMLNTALDEFAHRARLNEKLGAVTVVADQRYYGFPADMEVLKSVLIKDTENDKYIRIQRLQHVESDESDNS